MPEVWRRFGEFDAYLRLALYCRTDIDNFAGLGLGIRDAFQFQLLTLQNLGGQGNQGAMSVYYQGFCVFGELPLWALT